MTQGSGGTVGGGRGGGLTRVGPFRVLEVLGHGGMGVVYLAEQEEPVRRRVALKVLSSGRCSEQGIARMEAERQALALMNHPSIATVYDAGTTTDGLPYFAMELVRGATLIDYCDRHRLGLEERLGLFVQVCEAVEHAHQKMVIHRDLKPANVLVTEEDGRSVPKLIDFGIAKCLDRPLVEHESLVTREGLPLGTPMYMSPEQVERGASDLDARTDVYALGVLLYELLTGVLPLDLDEADNVQVMFRVLKVDYPRMSARFARLPADRRARIAAARGTTEGNLARALASDLEWITMKAVEKDRQRRYGSVGALRADLRHYRRSEPVQARPPSARYRVARFLRRYRLVVGASVAVGVALLVGLVIAVTSLFNVTRARDEARAAEARATATVDYLRKVLASVDPGVDGRQVRVVDMLANASAMIPEDLEGDSLVEASVRKTIGLTLLELGLFEEAGEQLERAVRIQTLELGPHDPETLHTVNSMGRQLYKLGRYEQAAAIHRSVLEGQLALADGDETSALWTRYHLAKALHRQGEWVEAEATYREVLRIRRQSLGPRHLDSLITASSLGQFLAHRGRWAEAELLLRETILTLEETAGAEHPDTLRARINLAELLNLAGRAEEAGRICDESREVVRAVLGPEHPEALTLDGQLSLALLAAGRAEEALALSEEILGLRLAKLGAEHPDVQASAVQVAVCRLVLHDSVDAERHLVSTLDQARRVLSSSSWQLAILEARAGRALVGSGRADAAEPLLLHSLEIAGRDDSELATWVADALVEVYETLGRSEEAQRYR